LSLVAGKLRPITSPVRYALLPSVQPRFETMA
jgi:hypothetical protein